MTLPSEAAAGGGVRRMTDNEVPGIAMGPARAVDVAFAFAFRRARQAQCQEHCFCELGAGWGPARYTSCCRCETATHCTPASHRARPRDAIGRWI